MLRRTPGRILAVAPLLALDFLEGGFPLPAGPFDEAGASGSRYLPFFVDETLGPDPLLPFFEEEPADPDFFPLRFFEDSRP